MGFESFRVKLADTRLSAGDIVQSLHELEGCEPYPLSAFGPTQQCFVIRRPGIAVELEVYEEQPGLSCRMTVCHPLAADDLFVDTIGDLMKRLSMNRAICSDRSDACLNIPFSEWTDFREEVKGGIARMRTIWQGYYGPAEGIYTEIEAHEHIILPQCLPAKVSVTT